MEECEIHSLDRLPVGLAKAASASCIASVPLCRALLLNVPLMVIEKLV